MGFIGLFSPEAAGATRYWVYNLHFCLYLGQFLTDFKNSFFPCKLMKIAIRLLQPLRKLMQSKEPFKSSTQVTKSPQNLSKNMDDPAIKLLHCKCLVPVYRHLTGILVYRDIRIVGVTCSMVLPQIIIENVSSNITGNSCCKYAI